MSLKSDLIDLVVPLESSYSLHVNSLIRLEDVLSDRNGDVTLVQWIDIASSVTNLPDCLLRIIFELCEDFFRSKDHIRSCFLVFALFLQNRACTRKSRLGEKKKRTFQRLANIFS